jgi:dipeptidyl aminopeptidase/acylaminoacyl peptidase
MVVKQFSVAVDGTIALLGATIRDIGDVYVLRGEDLARHTSVNEAYFASRMLSEPLRFPVSADDGEVLDAWMLLPPGHDGRAKVPAVLQIHGGPRAQYGEVWFHEFHMIAAMGIAVVWSNPRGSQGYGERFASCIAGAWGDRDFRDLMAVADEAVRRFPIDAGRFGVMGGSYGGYMTNWIIGHTDRFRCAITMRCVSNLLSMAGTSDFGYEDRREFGVHPWEDFDRLWRMSPLAYAARMRTPLLILHSEGDLRCPIEQAEQLFAYLKGQRREVEFVRFPEETHDLSRGGRPDRRVERLRHIARWLDRHLLG